MSQVAAAAVIASVRCVPQEQRQPNALEILHKLKYAFRHQYVTGTNIVVPFCCYLPERL